MQKRQRSVNVQPGLLLHGRRGQLVLGILAAKFANKVDTIRRIISWLKALGLLRHILRAALTNTITPSNCYFPEIETRFDPSTHSGFTRKIHANSSARACHTVLYCTSAARLVGRQQECSHLHSGRHHLKRPHITPVPRFHLL